MSDFQNASGEFVNNMGFVFKPPVSVTMDAWDGDGQACGILFNRHTKRATVEFLRSLAAAIEEGMDDALQA